MSRKGRVRVQTNGVLGSSPDHPVIGRLTCEYERARMVILLNLDGGATYSIPVQPPNFVPQREGDAVAWYRLRQAGVDIWTCNFGHPNESWRRIELV
jgi:hypothetical protein